MDLIVQNAKTYAYTGGRPFDSHLPVVLLIHGAQLDHSIWILQSRYLAHHGYSVLAIDLPGHGRSEGEPLTSIENMATWLIELLDCTGITNAVLVGHSMGSLIAVEAASRAPQRISKLVLLGSTFPMRVSDQLLAATRDDEALAIDLITQWSHSRLEGGFSHKPGNPGPGFSVVWGAKRLMERQNKGVLYQDFHACNAYANGEVAASTIECPSLFILGTRDAMTSPKSGTAFAHRFRGHQIEMIDGAGHSLMSEAPDAVLDLMVRFLVTA